MFLSPKNGSNSKLRFAILTPSSGGEQYFDGTAALPTGVWTHVAITLNGSVGTLYVNGTQVGQKTDFTVNPSSLGATTQNYLGKSQFSADPYLNGGIDDFRIYSRALSSSEVATLAGNTLPATPTGLKATSGDRKVILKWNSASGAASYIVKRATVSGGPYQTIANVSTTSFTDTGLTNGVNYYYVVAGSNVINAGADSTQSTAKPVALRGDPSYIVKRVPVSGGLYQSIANLSTTSFTDTDLTNGVNYYYVVAGSNVINDSTQSTAKPVALMGDADHSGTVDSADFTIIA
jgi:hypothetical protein